MAARCGWAIVSSLSILLINFSLSVSPSLCLSLSLSLSLTFSLALSFSLSLCLSPSCSLFLPLVFFSLLQSIDATWLGHAEDRVVHFG